MFKVSINITHITTHPDKINNNDPAIKQGTTRYHKTILTTYSLGKAIQVAGNLANVILHKLPYPIKLTN